jgi:transcription elongation GreA/GreB family factor
VETIDKEELRRVIVARLDAELATLVGAANSARAEATDVDNRQEGKFDMRGQLAAYMAAGQAKLAEELGQAVNAYRQLPLPPASKDEGASVGCAVRLDAPKGRFWYFLGPARGGMDVEIDGVSVTVVTASSPIGRALLGRRVGEAVGLPGQGRSLGTVGRLA